jgi:hypothetical protein
MDNKSENKLRTHPVLIPWSLKWAWLKRNIDRNLQNLEDIALYFWLGTCNLTSKDKSRFISLSTQNNETLDHIIRTLLEFKSFLADYTQVKLTFLEVPIYSMAVAQWRQMRQMPHFWNGKCNLLKANKIFFFFKICLNSPPLPHFIQTRTTAVYSLKNWNEHCKHKDPSTFKDQDKQLQAQIITLNKEIRKLNLDLNTNSPDFSVFLKASCRHRTRSRHDTWYYYNFSLYIDCIHPGQI